MSKCKVALVQCPQWDLELPPLGITYLSSSLKKCGHDVKIFDFNIDLFHEVGDSYKKYWEVGFEFENYWRDSKKLYETGIMNEQTLDNWTNEILKWEPKMIGFAGLISTKLVSMMLAKKIKEISPDTVIIFGGHECIKDRSAPEIFESGVVDIIVRGEGEQALSQIVNKFENNEDLDKIPGVLLLKNKKVIDGGYPKLIPNINKIPFPDFDSISLDKYLNKEALPILTSRGCINKCKYCSETFFWNFYRCRNAENIFEEMKVHSKKYKRNAFYFNDSLLNGNIRELEKLCGLIIESGLDIKWNGNACIRKEMTPELLNKMSKAGCGALVYGIESASDRILKNMGRKYDSKLANKVVRDTKKSGIVVVTNWILGFPGESRIDFYKTLWFLIKNRNYIKISRPGCSPFVFLGGTEMHKNHKDYGVVVKKEGTEWVSSDGKNTRKLRENRVKIFKSFAKYLNVLT